MTKVTAPHGYREKGVSKQKCGTGSMTRSHTFHPSFLASNSFTSLRAGLAFGGFHDLAYERSRASSFCRRDIARVAWDWRENFVDNFF